MGHVGQEGHRAFRISAKRIQHHGFGIYLASIRLPRHSVAMEGIGKERRCDEELARGRGDEEQQSTVEGAPFQPQPPFFSEINGGHFIALPKRHLVSSERSPFKRVLVERQHRHIQTSTAKACNWCSPERSRSHFAEVGGLPRSRAQCRLNWQAARRLRTWRRTDFAFA